MGHIISYSSYIKYDTSFYVSGKMQINEDLLLYMFSSYMLSFFLNLITFIRANLRLAHCVGNGEVGERLLVLVLSVSGVWQPK